MEWAQVMGLQQYRNQLAELRASIQPTGVRIKLEGGIDPSMPVAPPVWVPPTPGGKGHWTSELGEQFHVKAEAEAAAEADRKAAQTHAEHLLEQAEQTKPWFTRPG
jgi:hypothetical protein